MKVKICSLSSHECIDCGVCEPECPIDAIKADTDEVKDKEKWLLLNKSFLQYGLIFLKKEPMKDHKKFEKIKINMTNIFLKTRVK